MNPAPRKIPYSGKIKNVIPIPKIHGIQDYLHLSNPYIYQTHINWSISPVLLLVEDLAQSDWASCGWTLTAEHKPAKHRVILAFCNFKTQSSSNSKRHKPKISDGIPSFSVYFSLLLLYFEQDASMSVKKCQSFLVFLNRFNFSNWY
jgi:hypothetical protein